MSWRPRDRPHEVPYGRHEESQRTIREWSDRMHRLNSIDMDKAESQISRRSSRDYSGLFQYLTTNVHVGSGGEVRGRQMAPTNFERWASSQKFGLKSGRSGVMGEDQKRLCEVSPEECRAIKRCFEAADVTRDGYLDCEEFKVFMECRNSPVTHWQAKDLLNLVDPHHQSFINLDQIMFLVFHCGISTDEERPICPNKYQQFRKTLRRLASSHKPTSVKKSRSWQKFHTRPPERRRPQTAQRYVKSVPEYGSDEEDDYFTSSYVPVPSRGFRSMRSQIIEEPIPMDNAKNYFEDKANEVRTNATQEVLYRKYREEVRTGARAQPVPAAAEEAVRRGSGPPPGWTNMVLHSQDPSSHIPTPPFKDLKNVWQDKVIQVAGHSGAKEVKSKFQPAAVDIDTNHNDAAACCPSQPLSPELRDMAQKIEVGHTKHKFNIRTDVVNIFKKQSSCPSRGIPVLPDLPPTDFRLKVTSWKTASMARVEPSSFDEKLAAAAPAASTISVKASGRRSSTKDMAKHSPSDVSATEILFKRN